MPVRVKGCVHPRGLPDDWYKGLKYLKEKEILEKVLNLPNTISLEEHDPGQIGVVIGSMVDQHGQIIVDIEIPDNTPKYEEIKRKLLDGTYKGLSLGRKHTVDMNTGELVDTNIFEVSICEEGALPGTYIEAVTVASESKNERIGTGITGYPPAVDVKNIQVVDVDPTPFSSLQHTFNSGILYDKKKDYFLFLLFFFFFLHPFLASLFLFFYSLLERKKVPFF